MIYIGTDSVVQKDRIKYVTVVFYLPEARLEKTTIYMAKMSNIERLMFEATLTYNKFCELGQPLDAEMHFDFNPNPRHKSHKAYLAYRSLPRSHFKPNAWAASHVADYFANH